MKNDVILKVENLEFSYENDDTKALDGFSLEIKKGRKIALMGSNGSGKSSFFLCCTGINRPQKGKIYLHGEEIKYDKKSLLNLRSKVGIVFQDPDHQLFSASVYQEISFGILNLGVTKEEAVKKVEEVIEQLEITSFRHKPTHELSGGQKKQVSIADILVMHPEIIILDEPAAALDQKNIKIVNHAIEKMTEEGITVIMSTHDASHAYEWADEIVIMDSGKVLLHGEPAEVFSNKELLDKINLEKPPVMQLFESLCKKGVLNPELPLPGNFKELEEYIENTISIKKS